MRSIRVPTWSLDLFQGTFLLEPLLLPSPITPLWSILLFLSLPPTQTLPQCRGKVGWLSVSGGVNQGFEFDKKLRDVIELAVLVLGEVRLHATAKSMWSSTKCSPSRGGGEVRLGVI